MCGRGAVCVLIVVMSVLALVQSPKGSEGVPGTTDGGTPSDSDGDPPWVMEDAPQDDHLHLEGIQLRDSWESHGVESDSGTVGNGRLPPSVNDLDSNGFQQQVNSKSGPGEGPAVDDQKLSDERGSTARPPEQDGSSQDGASQDGSSQDGSSQDEELKSSSESDEKDSSQVSDAAVAEGELGGDHGHKEQEGVEAPEQVGGGELSNVGSSEENATGNGDTQGTLDVEEPKSALQDEPQEGEDDGKEAEKEEEEGDLTFEEFKRRKMMEQEAAQQVADSIASIPISKTKNNYASVDCGAKVTGTNHEARNPTAILIENRDVYMLNPCSADIWFVVELCDMVSVQTLEIACLELFSSVPEKFNVYSAERYPDPEWVHLGEFQAANAREVQSFPLAADQHFYAKYIKVEMVSHYGREHYCPISLLRVLGASMIEVFQYSEERKEQQSQQQPAVVLPPSEGFSEDDSLEVENERVRQNGALLTAAKDAVLSLLEQPLNLLGVNGFMKPGEGGRERTRHDCEEEGVEGCLMKEAAVTGEGMGGQEGGTPERTLEGGKILDTSDQDIPDWDPGEGREENVLEQDHHALSDRVPEVSASGSEVDGESSGRSSPRPEDIPSADPDTAPADTNLSEDPSGTDLGLGPSDPHAFRAEQEAKETSIDSENENSAQNSIDLEERSPLDGSTLQPQGEGNGNKGGLEVPPEDADRGSKGGQFQDRGELKNTTVDDSDLTTRPRDDHASTPDHASSPELMPPLGTAPNVLVEGEELGAGDGDWGLALDVGDREDTGEDDAGVQSALEQDGAKDNEIDDTLVSPGGEVGMGKKDGSPVQPLGPAVVSLGDTPRGNGEGVPQGDLPSTDIGLGPTMAPEEDVPLQNGERTAGGIQEVDSVGNQEMDLRDLPEQKVGNDAATADEDGESTSRTLPHEPSEDDISSCSRPLQDVSMAQNGSNDSSLASASEREDAGSHGNKGMTEEQLSARKLDDADTNGTIDEIPVNESLPTQPPGPEPGLPAGASLDQQNATGGSAANATHAKSSNETLLPPTNGSSIPAGQPKEKSVFVRLSNRIRDLEVNMSLFSSYLDQLSSSLKRNKNRTEDTQKSLDKRISALNDSLQSLKQEAELSVAGLRGVAADLCQVTAVVQEMAAALHSIQEETSGQHLLMGLVQMSMVTFQLLAVCLCLTCKQRSLGNELRTLRRSVARIPTQNHVTLSRDHMTNNHTHESQSSCYAAGLQPSNHIRGSISASEHLGSSGYYNCKDRQKGLATPSQSSLEGSDWDSEPWQLAARRRKKKGKSNKSNTS